MNVVAIIQARMGSSRLPAKTLADIGGRPLLARIIERVQACRSVNQVCVATTCEPADSMIVACAVREEATAFRGSTDDVLDRFYQAARFCQAGMVVRITADDPFKDPEIIDQMVETIKADPTLEYVSNTLVPTYPEGLDVEVVTFSALERAWKEASLPSEREHVTPYIWKQPERFRLLNVRLEQNLSKLRWTIDYEEDLRFAREIYARLDSGGVFGMRAILDLVEREPCLGRINQGITRNEGYRRSIAKEESTNS